MSDDLVKCLRARANGSMHWTTVERMVTEAANRIEQLETELHGCFHRIEELQAALRSIADNDSVRAGLDNDMYRRWRRVATDGIDIARAALEGKKDER